MWAAQLVKYNAPYTLLAVPIPAIRPNELLVRVHAAGFCHSDLQVLQGEFNSPLPMIPSHEPAGVVVEAGDEAAQSWKIGDRVGILNFKNACSKCPDCISTQKRYGTLDARFCRRRETAGFQHDGAFAEYIVADAATTIALPDSVSFEQAAPLLCAGATVYGAIQKVAPFLQRGDSIGIIGIGGLGQLGVQFATALGYRTVAIDNHDSSLQLIDGMPPMLRPEARINSTCTDAKEQIMQFTNDQGLAAAVVCTDPVSVTGWSLELLRIGGVLVPLGLPPDKWQFDSQTLLFRELVIRGNYVAGKQEVEDMMQLVAKQDIKSQLTVVRRDDIPSIPDIYKKRAFRGRLVVQCQ
ncbi:uncharacterized protein ACHE_40026S [Aspergillus chevalieri]|uniref:Enoyl reductase (ER) domain-containing protein n=1 Tax=Aspergillus chevalieri TaxID=182096 RepID=A0A7R7VMJ4_ASPCH|nr:uncharacterized protein ACHE_40026S [Aspergillus chevalieri]BCR87462.1 hypothetical protein ACHE_40026S [Aspergillus chevalieri]